MIRKNIRDAIVAAVTGLATTGSRVFRTRLYALSPEKVPGLCVYAQSEIIDTATIGSDRTQIRVLEVAVEGYAIEVNNLDNKLDQIGAEVEVALAADVTLGGLCQDVLLKTIEIEYSGEGDQPAGTIKLVYEVQYATTEGNP